MTEWAVNIQMGPLFVTDWSILYKRFSSFCSSLRTTGFIFLFLKEKVKMDMLEPLKDWLN